MAINKNSNGFTFLFAIVMVVVVGAILGFVSQKLKPLQDQNDADKKMMDILKSVGVESTRQNASVEFGKYVTGRVGINYNGEVEMTGEGDVDPKDKKDPFNIDVKKDYKNNIKKAAKKFKNDPEGFSEAMGGLPLNYPVFNVTKNDSSFVVLPVSGTGLWGPIWGYVALQDDYQTIYGVSFDHEGETPGLGAEIKEDFFLVRFTDTEKKVNRGEGKAFEVVKSGKKTGLHSVDGITGGTITSVGVGEMLDRTLKVYNKYFETLE